MLFGVEGETVGNGLCRDGGLLDNGAGCCDLLFGCEGECVCDGLCRYGGMLENGAGCGVLFGCRGETVLRWVMAVWRVMHLCVRATLRLCVIWWLSRLLHHLGQKLKTASN